MEFTVVIAAVKKPGHFFCAEFCTCSPNLKIPEQKYEKCGNETATICFIKKSVYHKNAFESDTKKRTYSCFKLCDRIKGKLYLFLNT